MHRRVARPVIDAREIRAAIVQFFARFSVEALGCEQVPLSIGKAHEISIETLAEFVIVR